MNLSDLSPYLLYPFKSEQELIRAIEELSLKFTQNRERIEDYLKDPRLVSAYTAFYLTTNIPKLKAISNWLPKNWLDHLLKCDFIDLGAGPGTFSLAWKEFGGEGEFYQIEKSELMRDQAKKIWNGFYPHKMLQQSSNWNFKTHESFVLFGHSANEMGPKLAINYLQNIRPDHVLFLEPGTKTFFKDMLEIREYLIKEGYNIIFPCALSSECPMKGNEDWCHQFIHVKQDSEVERLSQMARKDRKLLPLTVHAFSKTFKQEASAERVVRVHSETKFSFEWDVCHDNQLDHYQVMKRNLDKKSLSALSEVLSGDSIQTQSDKELETYKRVKITKINNYELKP
ncbi:MAG: small ribosomal subunit Rsm22 family protein [Bacteriovoracaceae bacterium]